MAGGEGGGRRGLLRAGPGPVRLVLRGDREAALDLHQGLAQRLTRFDVNEYAASVRVFAVKS